MMTLVHGTCVAFGADGVLILGPSGSGKSDLALRLIDEHGSGGDGEPMSCALVSDDQVVLRRSGDALIASPPEALRGLIEVRGLGIVRVMATRPSAALRLVVTFAQRETIDRLPDFGAQTIEVANTRLPELRVSPWDISTTAKIRVAITAFRRNVSSSTLAV
ncbi:HPr kinase/phosphorylase [Rhodoligotrophos ferricapiens]|uniref:HPr kinase/phosphorylase n=1 Tax=Rhodoligotrophos ferricapiens TaxID=3069264 RepID=UPI00315CD7F0